MSSCICQLRYSPTRVHLCGPTSSTVELAGAMQLTGPQLCSGAEETSSAKRDFPLVDAGLHVGKRCRSRQFKLHTHSVLQRKRRSVAQKPTKKGRICSSWTCANRDERAFGWHVNSLASLQLPKFYDGHKRIPASKSLRILTLSRRNR